MDPKHIIRVVIVGVASEVSQVLWQAKQLSSDLEIVSIENGLPATVVVDIPRRDTVFDFTVTRLGKDNPQVQCSFRLDGKNFLKDEGPITRGRAFASFLTLRRGLELDV